jgi:hypothetical protein
MKTNALFLFLSLGFFGWAQNSSATFEKYPVFPECDNLAIQDLEACFNSTLHSKIITAFNLPLEVEQDKYEGTVSILFEVTEDGTFNVLFVDATYQSLKDEVIRVFGTLPQITPATYSGNSTYMQFEMPLSIPLKPQSGAIVSTDGRVPPARQENSFVNDASQEFAEIKEQPYANQAYRSPINIPLSHHEYARFDAALNQIGANTHTAQKPFIYSEVNQYYDFETHYRSLTWDKTSWFGRKLWNEHLVQFSGEDYWVTLDLGVDLQAGRDTDANIGTYNNTRLAYVQGGLGNSFAFFAAVYESQGRFADYFNRYAESIAPDGGNPGIIPARGIAKRFRDDSYDYPVATGHISYTPSKYFNFQLGHGKTFLGDGYRSLLMSDNASPYPFFRINTTFWKLKYTNTWMSLRDVRPEVTADGSFRTKYMANHYLSYNVTKRLNIGLFESVIWENDNDRGFDFNYVNPVIFYRAIEFSTGSRGGNALIGLSAKYKFTDRINAYGQLIIDEFSSSDVFGGEGSYKNKTGYQLGVKYYDAFGLKDLYLQAEYNRVRPYTFSHNTVVLNYGHANQPLAHTLGANFSEFIAIARYNYGRIFANAKVVVAKRGLEFNTPEDSFFYGGSIYGTEDERISDLNNEVGQGNTTDFLHAEVQAGFIVNPATNLKLYASVILRDFNPEVDTPTVFENQTTWVNFGLRTDLFNWYYDF